MLGKLGIDAQVWNATDGAKISADEKSAFYDEAANLRRFKRPLTSAEIGCYLSHKRLWSHIASLGLPAALVMEDDALVDDRLPGLLARIAHEDVSDLFLKLDGQRGSQSAGFDIGGIGFVSERVIAPRTTGYIIGKNAAARLAQTGRFFRPVDIDLKHHWEHEVPIFTATPPLISEHPEPSTIDAQRQSAKGNPLGRLIANISYQARYRLAAATAPVPDLPSLAIAREPRA